MLFSLVNNKNWKFFGQATNSKYLWEQWYDPINISSMPKNQGWRIERGKSWNVALRKNKILNFHFYFLKYLFALLCTIVNIQLKMAKISILIFQMGVTFTWSEVGEQNYHQCLKKILWKTSIFRENTWNGWFNPLFNEWCKAHKSSI